MKTRAAVAVGLAMLLGACQPPDWLDWAYELPNIMGDITKELSPRIDSLSSPAYNRVHISASADSRAYVLEFGVEVNGERIKSRSLTSFDSTLRMNLRGGGDTLRVRAYAVVDKDDNSGTVFCLHEQLAVKSYLPVVASLTNTSKTYNMLVMAAAVTDDNGLPVTARGFCWNTWGNPTVDDEKVVVDSGVGAFSDTIRGLSSNTLYYIRAFAVNEAGTSYTDGGFRVGIGSTADYLPVISSLTNVSKTYNTLVMSATISDDRGLPVTERGFCWKLYDYYNSSSPTVNDDKIVVGSGVGTFSDTIKGLSQNTRYQVRAYAISAAGTSYYGSSFSTDYFYNATGVELNKTEMTITAGDSEMLTATVQPEYATIKAVTWTSSNPNVAAVSEEGLVTAVNKGTATITAATHNGYTASCAVTVNAFIPVTGVTLNKTAMTLATGETEMLTATVQPDTATNQAVTWTSSNPNVATVSEEGLVTAVAGNGTATITVATKDGNYKKTCDVTVNAVVTGITLNKESAPVRISETYELIATVYPGNAPNKTVTWASDNPAVATVNSSGVVTGRATGTANITATTQDGGYTKGCEMTVTPVAVISVTLNQPSAILEPGATLTLKATIQPTHATNKDVTWTSSNTNVATVVNHGYVDGYINGYVVAVSAGTTIITVKTQDVGFTATCTVTVIPAPMMHGYIAWASVNVDDYRTFAVKPDMYTKFYQWNGSTAWAATGGVSGWNWTTITSPNWTNNPCPVGWRLPTYAEQQELHNAGSTWAATTAGRGNTVNGRFYGTNHASCTLPNNMNNCIFLPAVGNRSNSGGTLYNQGAYGYYWSSTQASSTNGYGLHIVSSGSNPSEHEKRHGFSVRCVR